MSLASSGIQNHMQAPNSTSQLKLFFDGNCPLCAAEMRYLAGLDRDKKISFHDVRQPNALELLNGVSCQAALEAIHGQLSNGEIITGVDVFVLAYEAVGLKKLAWVLRQKSLRPFFDFAYRQFAKRRMSISKIWAFFFLKAKN